MTGCFTIERNICGLTTQEIEHKLGFRQGRLNQGCRILVLDREPRPGEYVPLGSTLYPRGEGLRRLPKFRPGAWLGQRLVKVEPIHPHTPWESYPPCQTIAAEQWRLTKQVPAHQVCVLQEGDTYWP
jgi:hypothetical protein